MRKLRSLFEFQRGTAETAQTAKACFAAGDYERAESLFSILLQDEAAADRLAHYCNRSACRLKLGRHDDAAADARVALEISPDSVKAHFRLASALVDELSAGAEGSGRRRGGGRVQRSARRPGTACRIARAGCAPRRGRDERAGGGERACGDRRAAARRGQAHGYALNALGASSAAAPPPPRSAADGTGDADGDAAAVVTLLSNRAAAALKLGQWADAAADARAAAARRSRDQSARARLGGF